ncbi:MAG: hypothetical protein JNJ45_01270 [Chthonomonas sp.]|nr:hypothetical protein [Chthonomonas sp.]
MKKILAPTLIAGLAMAAFAGVNSGLAKGESVSAFHPYHVSGPLANSSSCFPCTFKNRPQVQVWVNGDDMGNVATIAKTLEAAVSNNSKAEFKAMVVFVTSDVDATKKTVAEIAKKTGYKNIAMSVLSKDDSAVKAYKFNVSSDVKNTVFAYKNWKVENKMVNLKADKAGISALSTAISDLVK